jgi:cell division protein ZapA
MACDDGQEDHVIELGQRFEAAIEELRDSVGEVGDQRLMVMAGILMTDRVVDTERRLERLEQELEEFRGGRNEAAARLHKLEQSFVVSLENAAARIERIAERIGRDSESGEDATATAG